MDLYGGSVSNITLHNSPNWLQLVYNSSNIAFDSMYLNAPSSNSSPTANSDGIFEFDRLNPGKNLYCNDSHGISVGSLGQHIGQVDIVENILVCNTSLKLRNSTSTGGSSGWDRNVTYEGMHNYNNDWAIKMTQFYVAPNQTACNEHPASFIVEYIMFMNFDGTTSKTRAPYIASLSTPTQMYVRKKIRAENINVVSPSGTDEAIGTNMD
ncbi:hypothetical protein KXX16_008599 [Aspergillus fumigatus]|nr:hypothetical protein KXX31_002169 [Aspergillus fumigatus]KAH1648676.1 hypothetical protein KXX16_008599 [Aspergillus fumigatus]KAH2392049.1 hypothetical protein KXW92_008969 [Aspergillus fumigatus]KAH3145071.1 hypothetical protein KXW80_000725 [Aspergillus fumigatus]